MTGFAVEPEAVDAASSVVTGVAVSMQRELASLRAEAEALFGGAWHGVAAVGFRAAWQSWSAGALEVVAALDAMGTALGRAGVGYAGVEAAVTGDVARCPA